MPILVRRHKLLYIPVPKAACTSVKHALFTLDNGRPWQSIRSGDLWLDIHNFHESYGSPTWRKEHAWHGKKLYNFTVVRDPIERLLSCYSNRLVHHQALAPEKRRAPLPCGVPEAPTFDEFTQHLDAYRAASEDIAHHSTPMHHFLGPDLSFYNRIYRMDELDQLTADLGARTGENVTLPRTQTGGPKLSARDLSPKTRDMIRHIYDEDYRLLADHLKP